MKCTSNCSPALMKMVHGQIQFQFNDTLKTASHFPFSKSRADSVEQMRVRFHSEKGSPGDLGGEFAARIVCFFNLRILTGRVVLYGWAVPSLIIKWLLVSVHRLSPITSTVADTGYYKALQLIHNRGVVREWPLVSGIWRVRQRVRHGFFGCVHLRQWASGRPWC